LNEDAVQADSKGEAVRYLQRTDGKPLDETSPQYVVEPRQLDDKVQNTYPPQEFRVVLSDFGSGMSLTIIDHNSRLTQPASTFEDINDGGHGYPTLLRPPELLLQLPLSEKADIWCLGCVVCKFLIKIHEVIV
jgi:hypothetical protein